MRPAGNSFGRFRILRGPLYNLGGTAIYFAVQLLISILIARIIGFEGAGINALGMTMSNVFYPVALYGVRGFQVSDIHDEYAASDYFFLRLVTSAVAVFLFFILLRCVSVSSTVVLCAVAYTVIRVFEAFADLFFGFFQKRDRFDIIFVSCLLKGGISLVVSLVAMRMTHNVPVVVASMAVAFCVVFLAYDLPLAGRMTLGIPSVSIVRALLKKCFPLMAFTFVTPYINFVVRYAIEFVHGTEVQGYYSSIAILQAVMSTLASSVWVVFIPTFAVLYRAGDLEQLRRLVLRILVWVAIASGLALAITVPLGSPILQLVYGSGILPYVGLLLPVVAISAVTSVVMLLNAFLIAIAKNTTMLLANIGGAVAITSLAYPLIKSLGVAGANAVMLGGVVLQMILLAFPVLRLLQASSGRRQRGRVNCGERQPESRELPRSGG